MRFSLYLCFFIIYFRLFKVQFLYILLYIEIPCIILFLQKRYAHGTFAAGRAYMPTQEKKKTYDFWKFRNIRKISKHHRILT